MDQDRELFKLQAAAQHYEVNLEMGYNILIATALGLMFFSFTAVVSRQMSLLGAMEIWAGGFVATAFAVWPLIVRKYHRAMGGLDQHLKNLENGQPAPSLRELTKD